MAVVEVGGRTYHMNDNLVAKWDNIKNGRLKKIDEDRVYITDGRERTGKSLYTLQQGAYIDKNLIEDQTKSGKVLPRLTELMEEAKKNRKTWEDNTEWRREAIRRFKEGTLLPQIVFSAKTFLEKVRELKSDEKRTRVLQFDEAFRGMSSKGALSKENKQLVQALMEMGQNNLVVFIVSPSFFLLEMYSSVLRSNALFHINKDKKSGKRVVRIFNYKKKAILYQLGIRKGWGYGIRTHQTANFYNIYPGGDDFEWRYRLKKQLSLRETEKTEKSEEGKYKKQRDLIIAGLYEEINSLRKLSAGLKKFGVSLSPRAIGMIVNKFKKEKGKGDEIDLDEEKDEQSESSN